MKKTFVAKILSTTVQGCAVLALLFSTQNISAQVVAWNDDFSGGSIHSFLSEVTGGVGATVTQTGGQLIMNTGGSLNTARAQIVTDRTSSGDTNIGGNLAFNYMVNAVTTTFNIASVTTDADGINNTRPTFFYSIGHTTGNNYYNGLAYGVGIALEYLDLGVGAGPFWRFTANTYNGGITNNYLGSLSALPTSVTYTINNTAASISITGATFTSGGSGTNSNAITFGDLSGIGDFTQRNLAFGAYNLDTVNPQTIATLNSFQVSVVPEPSTWALLAGLMSFIVVFLRRRRTILRS